MVTVKMIRILISIYVYCATVWSDNKTYDWFDAQQICRNSSKRLPTHALNSSEFIWTGRHKRFSQWIKILGCYKDSNVHGQIVFNMTEYPSIGLCQEYCFRLHYNVYAIQASECRCLQDGFTTVPLPPNKCNGRCSNEEDDILSTECGGEEAFNVFSIENGTNFKDVGKTCMALQCNKDNASFHMQDCDDELGIICNFSEIHTDKKKWKHSFQSCKSNMSTNPMKPSDLSNAEETCRRINITYKAPLWIAIVREKYVSEDQGDVILNRKIITKCKKCKASHCEFETCSEQIITEVQCTAVSTPVYPHKESSKDEIDLKGIIGLSTAAFVFGITITVIVFLLCRRKKLQCIKKEAAFTSIESEPPQIRKKLSAKCKHYTKDDIRHLGRSNPTYVMTDGNGRESESPYLKNNDEKYDELHQKTSRKIERSDIFHYSLHIAPTYDVPNQKENKGRDVQTGYDVAFTNKIPEYESSEGLPNN